MKESINFTKQEMVDLLIDWADALYIDNPPKSIFEDNSQYVRDFVEGYFSAHFQPERSKREDTCTFRRMIPFTLNEIKKTHEANGLYEIKESDAVL